VIGGPVFFGDCRCTARLLARPTPFFFVSVSGSSAFVAMLRAKSTSKKLGAFHSRLVSETRGVISIIPTIPIISKKIEASYANEV
jgi:hypothetical protein